MKWRRGNRWRHGLCSVEGGGLFHWQAGQYMKGLEAWLVVYGRRGLFDWQAHEYMNGLEAWLVVYGRRGLFDWQAHAYMKGLEAWLVVYKGVAYLIDRQASTWKGCRLGLLSVEGVASLIDRLASMWRAVGVAYCLWRAWPLWLTGWSVCGCGEPGQWLQPRVWECQTGQRDWQPAVQGLCILRTAMSAIERTAMSTWFVHCTHCHVLMIPTLYALPCVDDSYIVRTAMCWWFLHSTRYYVLIHVNLRLKFLEV